MHPFTNEAAEPHRELATCLKITQLFRNEGNDGSRIPISQPQVWAHIAQTQSTQSLQELAADVHAERVGLNTWNGDQDWRRLGLGQQGRGGQERRARSEQTHAREWCCFRITIVPAAHLVTLLRHLGNLIGTFWKWEHGCHLFLNLHSVPPTPGVSMRIPFPHFNIYVTTLHSS